MSQPKPLLHREEPWLVKLVLALVLYSVLVCFLALYLGIHWGGPIEPVPGAHSWFKHYPPKDYPGYWQTHWALLAIAWFIVGLASFATWHAFFSAWEELGRSRVLHGPDGSSPPDEALAEMKRYFTRIRRRAFVVAVALALALTWFFDVWDVQQWYAIEPTEERTVVEQIVVHDQELLQDDAEYDWTIAAIIGEHNGDAKAINRTPNVLFNVAAYAQQVLIGAFGFLVLMQVIIHSVAFWFLEHLPAARKHHLEITLNSESPLHEFGLEHWNHALNNTYWILSLGMIVPAVSRASQPGGEVDTGQAILQVCLGALVILPMILTIVSRQGRLPKAWKTLAKRNQADFSLYHEQRLWPLDKNWVSKSGILLAFVLASYLVGVNLGDVLSLP